LNTGTTVGAKNNSICDEMKSTTDPRLKDVCCEKNSWALDRVEGPRADATGLSFQEHTKNDYQ
jgi:hypothetical protein